MLSQRLRLPTLESQRHLLEAYCAQSARRAFPLQSKHYYSHFRDEEAEAVAGVSNLPKAPPPQKSGETRTGSE